jgi:hypothetical protein
MSSIDSISLEVATIVVLREDLAVLVADAEVALAVLAVEVQEEVLAVHDSDHKKMKALYFGVPSL